MAVAILYNDPFLCGAHLYKHFGEFLSPLASALPAPPQWSDCVCRDDTLLMGKDTWCGETVKETRNLSTKLIPILWFSRILKIGKSSKRIRLHSPFTEHHKTNTHIPFPTWSDPWILSPRSVHYLNFKDWENTISEFSWEVVRLPHKGRNRPFCVYHI